MGTFKGGSADKPLEEIKLEREILDNLHNKRGIIPTGIFLLLFGKHFFSVIARTPSALTPNAF